MKKTMLDWVEDHMNAMWSVQQQKEVLQKVAALICEKLNIGGVVYVCGNGGSAADAEHFVAELSGRFKHDRQPLAAVCLNSNVATLTAIANDYGYEEVFARQLSCIVSPHDALIVLTTSGSSQNILRAVEEAAGNDTLVVAFTGKDGGFVANHINVNYNIHIPSHDTARIQEAHMFALHCLAEMIESEYVNETNA